MKTAIFIKITVYKNIFKNTLNFFYKQPPYKQLALEASKR